MRDCCCGSCDGCGEGVSHVIQVHFLKSAFFLPTPGKIKVSYSARRPIGRRDEIPSQSGAGLRLCRQEANEGQSLALRNPPPGPAELLRGCGLRRQRAAVRSALGRPDMSGPLEGADGGGDPRSEEPFCPGGSPSPRPPQHRPRPGPSLADDTDANSNGSSGNESNGPESRGASQRSSHSSSSGNGKDSALLETTESSKSTNSQSPSPPSSSIAYSLLSASSEQDNPSTSGCSSEQSARARTQKELMTALRELKLRLPPERRGKGRSGTLATLQYALACVKQVQANQEYYQQWSLEEGEPCAMDMSTYTLEELEHITSEYTLRNQDTFSVAVSFLTGRIVYISEQAGLLLRCKRDVFRGTRFSELLAPQDVGVFYGSTAPSRLPTWGTGASAGSGLKDFTQEKSVFCRIRGGPDRDPGPRYQPFRLTPYVTKIRVSDGAPAQPCCLLIAERIHSGYEAPRIPPDKRIFTTRHTPSCLFQDVDERAAPLLGYLPQDLLGAPVLLFLHPEDRPLMLAIHKKILQLAGQPFDHSPIRFCARNGEYVTMDTSWAGFVHPWSRKVAFVLGRHKVRTAPLNEDVFTPPAPSPALSLDPDIQELSEQIHRLLLQVTFQQICKDVHLVKHQGQQVFIESRARPLPRPRIPATGTFKAKTLPCQASDPELEVAPAPVQAPLALAPEEAERKEASSCSYQQINCLDSILRYLESCNIPSTTKRKCASSSSCTASSASDDDKQRPSPVSVGTKKDPSAVLSGEGAAPRKEPVVGGTLSPLALANKAESVVSVTSQCSFSSTIVHVGDKKPPESDIIMMEDLPGLPPGPAPSPAPSPMVAPDPAPDAYRPVGLTKAVLSLHTQKEEQAFLSRFRDLSRLRGLKGSSTTPSAPEDGVMGWETPAEFLEEAEIRCLICEVEVTESSNQDALSGSSDLLELLLQEDSRSGTGSAASGSLGSGLGSGSGAGSHEGGSTSASITRSSQSSHTSKYFGSIDSSEAEAGAAQARAEPGDQVIKYVLQDPIWLLMANADQHVMMTYQVPSRDVASVLKQDRERLRAMQKQQPRFSEDQRRELGAVHSWVRKGQLPRALDVMACVDCGSSTQDPGHPDDPLFSEMDGLGLEPMEEGGGEGGSGEGEGGDETLAQTGARVSSSQDLAMEEEEQGGSSFSPALLATENGTS
ncbi:Period circadian protein-like protein 1 [Camelus dromedarius]|uniref:Period circadian protein-like protein 1 n=1 Tax=Camelus dromedarius TaxID=9838 RepID=A0A5N4D3P9_CAMDR|nr:Period circadian protein-like protein 1 [Camelus dromedarius]